MNLSKVLSEEVMEAAGLAKTKTCALADWQE